MKRINPKTEESRLGRNISLTAGILFLYAGSVNLGNFGATTIRLGQGESRYEIEDKDWVSRQQGLLGRLRDIFVIQPGILGREAAYTLNGENYNQNE
jgi:hypothetical protein